MSVRVRINPWEIALLSTLICSLHSLPVMAFEGEEHRAVSRAGAQIAKAACEADPGCKLDAITSQAVAPLFDEKSDLDYGRLVSSIDYRIDPLQILEQEGWHSALPSSRTDLSDHLVHMLTSPSPIFLRAATVNDTHFQGELVANLRNWHAYAVAVAAGDGVAHSGNLYGALMINSFGDHFVEDFFAPGHIITPRFGLHDAVALAMHNYYNILGANFVVAKAAYEQDLAPLKPFQSDAGDEPSMIPLWGDGDLFRSPDQRRLMELIVARSVLDVLESFASGKQVNHLKSVGWYPMVFRLPPDLARASLPYGEYKHGPQTAGKLAFSSVVGVSVGAQSFPGSQASIRALYEFDYLLLGLPPIGAKDWATLLKGEAIGRFKDRQWGITIGYSYANNASELARGPQMRFIYAAPLIHSQASLDIARKLYHTLGQEEHGWSTGLRFQTGFSLLNLDLGIARDSTYREGRLETGLSFRAGFSIMGPLTSIPKVGNFEKAMYRSYRERKQ
jgi:hypothetical protein